ncbi:hypothetical protein QJS10_CPB19g00725 [Acorus calamus]|uniref:Uncharacterized protein n=1 Tax=Acorus calamus TaxID=4465 RepID=A0AAV9CG07_ACOCL|nr:hypothetical protein QJS10_CPB19g00725 [Acorus calamus]
MTVKSFNGSLQHIRCDQSFQRTRTSTVTLPLEELLNSTDLVNQVADMLIHADYGFTKFTERISKFIYKEASRLGPEYQMVRIKELDQWILHDESGNAGVCLQKELNGSVKEREVNSDLYIIDCFEMTLKSFNAHSDILGAIKLFRGQGHPPSPYLLRNC